MKKIWLLIFLIIPGLVFAGSFGDFSQGNKFKTLIMKKRKQMPRPRDGEFYYDGNRNAFRFHQNGVPVGIDPGIVFDLTDSSYGEFDDWDFDTMHCMTSPGNDITITFPDDIAVFPDGTSRTIVNHGLGMVYIHTNNIPINGDASNISKPPVRR